MPALATATLPPSPLSCSRQEQQEGPPHPVPPPTVQQLLGGGRQGEASCRHAEVPDQHLHQRAGEPAEQNGSADGAAGTRGHPGPQSPSSHCQALPFLYTGKESSKVLIQKVGFARLQSGTSVSSTHLGSSASSKVDSMLLGSSLSQWLWGCCSSPPASAPLAGPRGQSPQGRDRGTMPRLVPV